MSQVTWRRTITHIGLLQIAIIVLAVITALIHLDRGIMMSGFGGAHAGGPSGGPRQVVLLAEAPEVLEEAFPF